jgi:hypothetical protein
MLPINWNTAILYAKLVAIAESVAPTGSYDTATQQKISALGYKYLQTIYGDDLATDVDAHLGDIVPFGFLAVSPSKELVVSIRGTDSLLEWLHDASFLMIPSPVPGTQGFTEDGFTAVYRSLRVGQLNGSDRAVAAIKNCLDSGAASSVTVCGHSLGGALATLLTVDVAVNTSCKSPQSYTYASPRVGDFSFVGAYNSAVSFSYRVANRQDLVPKLPPILPLPYEHVNTLYELNPPPKTVEPTIPCMHHLTTYLWLMGKLAGTNAGPLDSDCVFQAGSSHV